MKLLVIFVALFFWDLGFAHPGGTDASGCHKEKSTGDHHCHGGSSGEKTTLEMKKDTSDIQMKRVTKISTNRLQISNDGYTVWIDCEKRLPYKFRYNAQRDRGNFKRLHDFKLDPDIPKNCNQKSSKSYKNGYDRGHMVPANHLDQSVLALTQSNYMSNIAPQHKNMNRGAWLYTEKLIECYRDKEELLVLGGAIWDGKKKKFFADHGVVAPSHFWKVIIKGVGAAESYQAWLLPNTGDAKEAQVSSYQIKMSDLEKVIKESLPYKESKKSLEVSPWPMPKNCDLS